MKLANISSSPLKIRPGRGGVLHLSGSAIAGVAAPKFRRELIDRCFTVPALRALEVNGASLRLRFDAGSDRVPETLDALSSAMQRSARKSLPLAGEEIVFSIAMGRRLQIRRVGDRLTFWRIEEEGKSSYRCFHPLIVHAGLREKVLEELSTLAGIEEETASRWLPGSVVVRCRPERITPEHLLDVLEPAVAHHLHLWEKPVGDFSPLRAVISTHAVLAPVSDYLLPQIRGISTTLLAILTANNGRRAWHTLRERRVTLSSLHTWMGSLGLIAQHFTGDALLTWFLDHWPRRVQALSRKTQRKFLSHYRRYPRRVWVDRDGAQTEVSLANLKHGDLVVLRHGDIVPGDGEVVDGDGAVRENWITGGHNATEKKAGDVLYASSRLTDGELRMRLTATGPDTVAARLAAWYERIFANVKPDEKAKNFGDKTALPALILSAACLNRGGIPMAKAAGHPDYLTGPALTADLCGLAGIIQSGLLGIHVSSPLVLERIAEADCFVIDDSAASWTGGNGSGETIGDRLRQLGVKEVALLSHRSTGQLARLGEQIGADFVLGEQGPLDRAAFISQRRYFGHKVAYFGSMGENAPAAKAADVAVVVAESLEKEMPDAGVVLRRADLDACALLRLMGTGSLENRKTGLQVAFAFNLTCSAAAVFANFSILAVVALTNISTWLNYVRSASALQSAVDSAED